MTIEFKAMSDDEIRFFTRWQSFRNMTIKQKAEIAHARARIAGAKRFRERFQDKGKKGSAILTWISLQEARAFRKLRMLPGALNYSRYHMMKTYEKIMKEKKWND